MGNASDNSPVHQTIAKLLRAQFDGIKKEPLPRRWLELINGLEKGGGQKAFVSAKAKK